MNRTSKMDLPFIYRRKSAIDVGLHRTIFLPQLLAVEKFRSCARCNRQVDGRNLFDMSVQDRMTTEFLIVDWKISDE